MLNVAGHMHGAQIACMCRIRLQQTVTPMTLELSNEYGCDCSLLGVMRLALHALDPCWLSPCFIRHYHHHHHHHVSLLLSLFVMWPQDAARLSGGVVGGSAGGVQDYQLVEGQGQDH